MRNRAKCKLCNTVLESFHSTDYVICQCREIALEGGEAMKCYAKNWNNFIRIDDEGKEFQPQIVEDVPKDSTKPNRAELMDMLDASIKSYDNLPPHALDAPVTHADMISLMLLMQAILRSADPTQPSWQFRCAESCASTVETVPL